MSASVVDELQIDIEAGLKSSGDLNGLVASLEKLQKVVNKLGSGKSGEKFAKSMESANRAVSELAASVDKLDTAKLDSLTNAVNALSGSRVKLSSVSESISKIGESAKKTASEIGKATTAINGFQNVGDGTRANEQTSNARPGGNRAENNSVRDLEKQAIAASRAMDALGKSANYVGLKGLGGVFGSISGYISTMTKEELAASGGIKTLASMSGKLASLTAGLGVASASITAVAAGVKAIVSAYKKLEGLGEKVFQTAGNAAKKAASAVRSFGSMVASVASKVGEAFSKLDVTSRLSAGFDSLKAKIADIPKKAQKSLDELGKKVRKLVNTFFYMGVRKIFTAMYSEMGNAIGRLASYSAKMGTAFNNSVSSIKSDFTYLADSIIGALEPVINAVSAMLTSLVDQIVQLINVINQFLSALGGGVTWTKANRGASNYADSLEKGGKAAKKLKDYTLGIDELNIFNDKDNSGSGGGGLFDGEFNVQPIDPNILKWADFLKNNDDWFDFGKMLGDKLAEALARIPWDKIKANARKLAKRLATLINGFIEGEFNGIGLGWWIGYTIAQGLNTAFEFLNEFIRDLNWDKLADFFMDGLLGFMQMIDWPLIYDTMYSLGKGITDFLNKALSRQEVWDYMGITLYKGVNGLILGIQYIVNHFEWDKLGGDFARSLGIALTNISWAGIANIIANGLNGVASVVKNFAKTFPWSAIAGELSKGINGLANMLNFGEIELAALTATLGVVTALNKMLDDVRWDNLGGSISRGIDTVLHSLELAVTTFHWDDLGIQFGKLVAKVFTIDWVSLGATVARSANGIIIAFNNALATIRDEDKKNGISQNFIDGINEAIEEIKPEYFAAAMTQLGGMIGDWFGKIFSPVEEGGVDWGGLGELLGSTVRGLFDGLAAFIEGITPQDVANSIKTFISNAMDSAKLGEDVDIINKGIEALRDILIDVANSDAWENMLEQCKEAIQRIDWGAVADIIVEFIKMKFEAKHATFVTLGLQIVGSLIMGMLQRVGEKIGSVADAIYGGLNGAEQQAFFDAGFALGEKITGGAKEAIDQGDIAGAIEGNVNKASSAYDYLNGVITNGGAVEGLDKINGATANITKSTYGIGIMADSLVLANTAATNAATSMQGILKPVDDIKTSYGDLDVTINDVAIDVSDSASDWIAVNGEVQKAIDALAKSAKGTAKEFESWEEFVDFMTDFSDKVGDSAESLEDLNTRALDTTTAIDSISEAVSGVAEQIQTTVDETIAPAFDSETWVGYGENIQIGLQESWDATAAWWADEAMPNFFEKDVKPWWTEKAWTDITNGMLLAIKNQFARMDKQWVEDINKWWEDHVAFYFKEDRWSEMLEVIPKTFGDAFKSGANRAIDALNVALGAIQQFVNECVSALNSLISQANEIAGALGTTSPISTMSTVHVSTIPHFETGGYVNPGSLFYANENGMVEAITNEGGRTQVTSHDELSGIRSALYETSDAEISILQGLIDRAERVIDAIESKNLTIGDREIAEAETRGRALIGRSILT